VFVATGLAVCVAADNPVDARAERLAKMAHVIDVREAMGHLADCEAVLRTAPARRDPAFSKVAREEVQAAKRALADVRERGPKAYIERARRVAERQPGHRPDQDEFSDVQRERLSAGEWALERLRHSGPVTLFGAALDRDRIGLPQVTVSVANWTDDAVEAFDLEVECWNSFDEPVGLADDGVMRAAFVRPLAPGQVDTGTLRLFLRDTTARVSVRVTRAKPAGGEVWEQTREEAERSPGAIVDARMRD
jgi:hypothetical protein